MRSSTHLAALFGALGALAGVGPAASAEPDAAFLAGYATAVIERDLALEGVRVVVVDGVAVVTVPEPGGVSPDQVSEAVARIEGIHAVEVRVPGEPPLRNGPDPESADREAPEAGDLEFLPRRELFDPLLADPRQPHFSASYLWYLDDPELGHVGSANFGETFALLGGGLGEGSARWEIGLLGAVFSVFDLDAESYDLVNSDFWVAPTFSVRKDVWSAQLRVYHQSSHLGDEFLLRNRIDRVNLSYEGADLILSADPHPALRIYLGGGAILHSEPDLDPFSAQAGVELESPVAFLGGVLRPVAAADLQLREENDWKEEISAVAGIQLQNPEISPLRLLILAEYFRGNSPNGQFFERRIEYLGVGAHLHF